MKSAYREIDKLSFQFLCVIINSSLPLIQHLGKNYFRITILVGIIAEFHSLSNEETTIAKKKNSQTVTSIIYF